MSTTTMPATTIAETLRRLAEQARKLGPQAHVVLDTHGDSAHAVAWREGVVLGIVTVDDAQEGA